VLHVSRMLYLSPYVCHRFFTLKAGALCTPDVIMEGGTPRNAWNRRIYLTEFLRSNKIRDD